MNVRMSTPIVMTSITIKLRKLYILELRQLVNWQNNVFLKQIILDPRDITRSVPQLRASYSRKVMAPAI